jgi:hypothetical protein
MDDDATVRLPSPLAAPAHRRRWAVWAGAGALALAAGGGVAWRLLPATAPVATAAPPLLDIGALLTHRATVPTALRWASNRLVWVLDFPDLESQGQAMNRAAAFLEKARAPRDRVLDDIGLAAAIGADGRDTATWYFGHNYRAADLERMLAQAARQGVAINAMEAWVAAQLALARRIDPARGAAILTLPALGARVDMPARRSILLHELGHGQFITQPLFAAHVMRVWERDFSEAERAAFRRFLGQDGYDTGQEEMMANEAMAYLLYTPDRRFFDPARDLGWTEAQVEALRLALREGAPPEP